MPRTVRTADTHLHVEDAPGGNPPLVFLNGGFATLRTWDRVIARLGSRHRTVRFDARGRGRSGTSADYSVAGAIEDVGRVLAETGVTRPVLVGWSHGATLAVRYALANPSVVAGLVLVDGAYPIAVFDDAGRERVRAQLRRLGWLTRIMSVLGLSARMSVEEAADVVLDVDEVNGRLDFAGLTCPTVYVLAQGTHSGATEDEVRRMRAATSKAVESNELVSVLTTVPVNHVQVLRKAPDVVVAAIDEVVRRG